MSRALGVSGDEKNAAEVAKALLAPLVDEVKIDHMGNVLGFRRSRRENAKTILLDAHLDEVGLMVSGRDATLFRLTNGVGGVDVRMLPGQKVFVLTQPPIPGIVRSRRPDETTESQGTPLKLEELRVDCGLSQEQLEKIPVGTRVAYGTQPFQAGNRMFGKSLDDRACFAAILRAMELTKEEALPVHVVVQGSVQEECGGLGALTGTYGVMPDVAVVSDVTFGDSPDSPKEMTFPLGSGAAIGYSPVLDRTYTRRLRALAEKEEIPYVQEIMENSTGTNSMETQIAGNGVPSVLISMPLRYMHTPVEEIDLRDLEAVAQLMAAFLRSFAEDE